MCPYGKYRNKRNEADKKRAWYLAWGDALKVGGYPAAGAAADGIAHGQVNVSLDQKPLPKCTGVAANPREGIKSV